MSWSAILLALLLGSFSAAASGQDVQQSGGASVEVTTERLHKSTFADTTTEPAVRASTDSSKMQAIQAQLSTARGDRAVRLAAQLSAMQRKA